MDRDRAPRVKELQRGGGPDRVHVAAAERGAPAAHRQDREIHARRDVEHLGEQVGVAGEVDARVAADHVAERGADRAERHPSAGMESRHRPDVDAADPDRVTGVELEHLGEAHRADHRAAAAGHDQRRGARQLAQRRQVR